MATATPPRAKPEARVATAALEGRELPGLSRWRPGQAA